MLVCNCQLAGLSVLLVNGSLNILSEALVHSIRIGDQICVVKPSGISSLQVTMKGKSEMVSQAMEYLPIF